jgi:hypothetical protein
MLLAMCLLVACGSDEVPADNVEQAKPIEHAVSGELPRTASPVGARVFFIMPANGETVPATFTIEFGVGGMTVVPAGDNTPDSGHHHLLIDTDLPENLGLPIPADANHVHFGDGSTSTERTLAPGQHTLQLLFADHLHIPHSPPVYSERITVTVK